MNTPHTPLIRTQTDLEDLWHDLLGPLGFDGASLWLMVIGTDDRPVPCVTEIADARDLPDDGQYHGFAAMLADLVAQLAPGGRIACLRSRPGTEPLLEEDRSWARLVHDAARAAGVPCDVVHMANDVRLLPIPLDELGWQHSA